MRILVDLDNCVFDFYQSFRDYYCKEFGVDRSTLGNQPNHWHFYRDWGLTDAEFLEYFARGVDSSSIFSHGYLMPDAKRCLVYLQDRGHSIHLATDRFVGRRSFCNTEIWLKETGIPYDSLTFTRDKSILRCAIGIDDKPENVTAMRRAGIEGWMLCQNRTDQQGKPHAIHSWDEFLLKVGAKDQAHRQMRELRRAHD